MYRQRQGKCFDGREDCRCSRVWIGKDVSAQADDIARRCSGRGRQRRRYLSSGKMYRHGRYIGRKKNFRENIRQEKYFGKYIAEDRQQGDGTAMYRLQSKSAKIGEDREKKRKKNETLTIPAILCKTPAEIFRAWRAILRKARRLRKTRRRRARRRRAGGRRGSREFPRSLS